MKVSFGAGRSLARLRTRGSISGRAKYLKTIKSSRSSATSRLSSVRKNTASSGTGSSKLNSSVKVDLYSDLETAAKGIQKNLKELMKTGDESLFTTKTDTTKTGAATDSTRTEQSGGNAQKDTTTYSQEITGFVKHYNEMIEAMSGIGDTTNIVYMANLRSDLSAQSKALEKAGITVNKDGSLKINEEELKKADAASVEALFGSKGSVSTKVSKYATSIEKYASRTLNSLKATDSTSLSSVYNRYGSSVNNYYNSRYNYRG